MLFKDDQAFKVNAQACFCRFLNNFLVDKIKKYLQIDLSLSDAYKMVQRV